MKLLFDNNLSYKLVARLSKYFPESSHVMFEELDEADDLTIWEFAEQNSFTIVTKDIDFNELSVIKGHPPKVVLLSVGNCRVKTIEDILKQQLTTLIDFNKNKDLGFIEVC